jgi:hypothetical protein
MTRTIATAATMRNTIGSALLVRTVESRFADLAQMHLTAVDTEDSHGLLPEARGSKTCGTSSMHASSDLCDADDSSTTSSLLVAFTRASA